VGDVGSAPPDSAVAAERRGGGGNARGAVRHVGCGRIPARIDTERPARRAVPGAPTGDTRPTRNTEAFRRPIGPGSGGGAPSRPTPGLRRGRPAGRLGSGDEVSSRTRSPAGMSSRLVLGPAAGFRLGGRGLRREHPAGWSRVWWRASVSAGAWRSAGCPAGRPRARRRDFVSAGEAFGGTPGWLAPGLTVGLRFGGRLAFGGMSCRLVPGPAVGLRSGGRGVSGRRPPSELSRTESPAPARRGSAGPRVRHRLVGALSDRPSGPARTAVTGRRPGPGRSRHGHADPVLVVYFEGTRPRPAPPQADRPSVTP
jgi:hypothetical protein